MSCFFCNKKDGMSSGCLSEAARDDCPEWAALKMSECDYWNGRKSLSSAHLLQLADELYSAFVSVDMPTPGQREALDNWAKASNMRKRADALAKHDHGDGGFSCKQVGE